MSLHLSAIVLTRNEERNIVDCLRTLSWADEVLVLDSGSEDATVDLAQRMGARVETRPFDNFPRQRNAALELARGQWVFFVDADERATEELAGEVGKAIAGEEVDGFWVPRRNYIFGRWIRHAGWYPDYQLRLFRRHKGRHDESREVHELVILDGPQGYLESPLIHYNYDNISQFIERQNRYTEMEAAYLFREGTRAKVRNFVLQPCREFRRRYITLQGYKDGRHGLLLSLLMAYYEGVKYLKLWRLQRRGA
ncbi:MAG: glycosyltransferase family 2 protein [Anaerolineae bacterium]